MDYSLLLGVGIKTKDKIVNEFKLAQSATKKDRIKKQQRKND